MELADRVFLVTGGGSGLGAACARHFAARGAKVIVADIRVEAANALAGELGAEALAAAADVTSPEQVSAAIEAGRARFGGLHGVIHCAGIIGAGRIVSKHGPHDLDLFRRVVEVNLVGTFNVLRLAAAAMTRNEPNADGERGVIITTASVAAFEGQIGQAAYSAAKGGVAALTLPAARELAKFGIRVVSIAPGIFETDMTGGFSPELRATLEAQVPFPPRFGRPEEFARLAEQIVVNPPLNGTVIRLDGALRMA